MFEHCLICTEFSDGLDRLVNFVPSLAKGGLKRIVFVHCLPVWEQQSLKGVDPEAIAAATAKLAPAQAEVPEGVEVKIEIASDRPVDVVPHLAVKYGIDLILAGLPFRSSIEEKLTGSTAMAIARSTTVPLMLFRPEFFSVFTQAELRIRCANLWRYLLVPYNDDAPSHYLLEEIRQLLSRQPLPREQSLLLLWVVGSRGRKEILTQHRQEEAQAKLQQIQAEFNSLGINTQIIVQVGDSIHEVLRVANNEDLSAIAIASLHHKSLLDWTVPQLNEEMLRHSWFPLLFLSPKK